MLLSLLRIVCRLLWRLEIQGDTRVFNHSKLLITPNHVSFLDGLLLAIFLPIKPVFAVHNSYVNSWCLRLVKSTVDFVALDPSKPLSLKQLLRLIEQGRPVVLFPEGRISVTGTLMKIYSGTALVAAKSQALVVPVRIEGAEYTPWAKFKTQRRWLPKIRLVILPATRIPMPEGKTANQRRHLAGEHLSHIMQEARMLARPKQTLFQAFTDAARRFGWRHPCLEDIHSQPESYRSVLKKILAISRLIDKWSQPRVHLGLLLPNTIISSSVLMAATLRGRVPAMLNYTAGVAAIGSAIEAAQIRSVITSRQFIDKADLHKIIQQFTDIQWLYLEDLQSELKFSDKLWIATHLLMPHRAELVQQPEDSAIILFTSGSEETAKGVVHSHKSLLSNVEQIRTVADFGPDDVFMSALPLFHAFGLTVGLFLPLITGAKAFLYPSPLHYKVIPELIYDKDCTVIFGTSTFLGQYAAQAHPYDFARLRYVVAGAEKLQPAVAKLYQDKFGISILEGYGATECAPVISINVPGNRKPATVGRLLPALDSRLISVPGIEQGGRLQVKGPNIMKGYLRSEKPGVIEPPAADNGEGHLENGWYDTGDIVTFDADGFCQIQGRVKRFAKLAGEMISLEKAEALALLVSPDHQHVMISRADSQRGEALVLFTTDRSLCRESLRQAARQQGSSELLLTSDIRWLAEIPYLATGKPDYRQLQELGLQPSQFTAGSALC